MSGCRGADSRSYSALEVTSRQARVDPGEMGRGHTAGSVCIASQDLGSCCALMSYTEKHSVCECGEGVS